MVVVGLVVERFCRIPPEDGDADAAKACRKARKPRRKANMHTEAIDPTGHPLAPGLPEVRHACA